MEKTLTIFAGINGAGKSTLYNFKQHRMDLGVRICPDEILQDFGGDWENVGDVFRSGKIAIQAIDQCLNENVSFNWETTIISSFFLKLLQKAKEKGYETILNFIGVEDLQLSLERIKQRVQDGGHGIDEKVVATRHRLQLNNIIPALDYLDVAIFYDNAKTPKIVAMYSDEKMQFYSNESKWIRELQEKYENERKSEETL